MLFDTYRFSEDLDFTIPDDAPYDAESVRASLLAVADWVRDRLTEVLAEKVRALLERSGRARDVYDVVNIGRNLRDELSPTDIAAIAVEKFRFKDLDPPSPDVILARVDPDVFATDWGNALRHQLPALPPAADFLGGLRDVLDWLFVVGPRVPELTPVPGRKGEVLVPPVRFMGPPVAARAVSGAAQAALLEWPAEAIGSGMDRIRYAARNRLLVRITYHGVSRLVEPYSLRMPRTGNLLLYVYEVERGGGIGGSIKAFKVAELGHVHLTNIGFQPRYLIEL